MSLDNLFGSGKELEVVDVSLADDSLMISPAVFDILNTLPLPNFYLLGSDKDSLRMIADFFGFDDPEYLVAFSWRGHPVYYVEDENDTLFWFKKLWEGSAELVGLHLHNLISDYKINYVFGSNVLATVPVGTDVQARIDLDDFYHQFRLGHALAFTEALHLGDRCGVNYLRNLQHVDDRYVNIDFGCSFFQDKQDRSFIESELKKPTVREGYNSGFDEIMRNCRENKEEINALLRASKDLRKRSCQWPIDHTPGRHLRDFLKRGRL